VLVGLMDTNHLPAHLQRVWERLPRVITGVRTRDPALSYSCVDHYNLALIAFERALALGYRRPGLVLDDVIDALVERRFSAGYVTGQRALLAFAWIDGAAGQGVERLLALTAYARHGDTAVPLGHAESGRAVPVFHAGLRLAELQGRS